MSQDVLARTVANRRLIAALFEDLDADALTRPSLCAGWTVRDVLGHLVMSLELGFGSFLWQVVRDRGRVAHTSGRLARSFAERPVGDLVGTLRERSEQHAAPPGIGPMGPMADSCIHLRDVAVPLGLDASPALEDWRMVLDFLLTRQARAGGFVVPRRLTGLAFRATDQDWSAGSPDSAEVRGPSESLALAISGRAAGLDALDGAGVAVLRDRL